MAKISLIINEISDHAGDTLSGESRLVKTALLCELAGADGVVVKIKDDGPSPSMEKSLKTIEEAIDIPLAVVTAAGEKQISKLIDVKPDMIVLRSYLPDTASLVTKIQVSDIVVGITINPELDQVKETARMKADYVVFDVTGYCTCKNLTERLAYIDKVAKAAALAQRLSVGVIVSGPMNPSQLGKFTEIDQIDEYFLGSQVGFAAIGQGLQKALMRFKEVL